MNDNRPETSQPAPRDEPRAGAPDALETARGLAFQGQYAEAAALLHTTARTPGERALLGALQLFTGEYDAAAHHLTEALMLGHRGALAGLATLQRLRGGRRDAILELREADLETLDDFDRANLEREVALQLEQDGRHEAAREWFERAWTSAQIGTYGAHQIGAIGHGLGRNLVRLGYDALAVNAFDEALRAARPDRRAALHYERAQAQLNLGAAAEARLDLEGLEGLAATRQERLLAHYLAARVAQARGEEATARNTYALIAAFADPALGEIERDIALHATLWAAKLEIDSDTGSDAEIEARLAGAAKLARTEGERWQLELRRAHLAARRGDPGGAARALVGVTRGFAGLGRRAEASIARLYRAEALLRDDALGGDEADAELLPVAAHAAELGGAARFRTELENLTGLRARLERERDPRLAVLRGGAGLPRVARLRGDRLELEGGPGLEGDAARLVGYLVAHPSSTAAHLRGALLPGVEAARGEAYLAALREQVSSLPGFRVHYRPGVGAYSLAWTGITLERQ